MTATSVNKEEFIHDQSMENILIIIIGTVSTTFVLFTEKIFAFILGVSYVNTNAKEFMMDLAPFIGAGTGLMTLIWFVYKIMIAHQQLKHLKNKDKK